MTKRLFAPDNEWTVEGRAIAREAEGLAKSIVSNHDDVVLRDLYFVLTESVSSVILEEILHRRFNEIL